MPLIFDKFKYERGGQVFYLDISTNKKLGAALDLINLCALVPGANDKILSLISCFASMDKGACFRSRGAEGRKKPDSIEEGAINGLA